MTVLELNFARFTNVFFAVCGLLPASLFGALDASQWEFQQTLRIDQVGPLRLLLPPEALDRVQSDLRDLRVLDGSETEVPAAILVRPFSEARSFEDVLRFRSAVSDTSTVLTVEARSADPWEAIELLTTASSFIKSVRIESSEDGKTWTAVDDNVPFFRQEGAQQTILPFSSTARKWLRLTISDARSNAIAVTSARLRKAEGAAAETESAVVVHTVEHFADASLVTLRLPAANLNIDSVVFELADPIFARAATASIRRISDGASELHEIAAGTLFRISTEGSAQATALPIRRRIADRELIVRIQNGDSPPLQISGAAVKYRPSHLAFNARTTGEYRILSGNPDAASARYDLNQLEAELSQLPATPAKLGTLEKNARYSRVDPFQSVTLEGGPIDVTGWTLRWPVNVANAGIQLLELDLGVLTKSVSPQLRDLRLVRGDRQIPYIVERLSSDRAVDVELEPADDPKRPSVSRWKVELPYTGAKITRVIVESDSALFDRRIAVYETRGASTGDNYIASLGEAQWVRLPGTQKQSLSIATRTPSGRVLFIETDNGDNQPIILTRAKVGYPAVRLVFRAERHSSINLLAGNSSAQAPRYDLELIAPRMLGSEKHRATVVAEVEAPSQRNSSVKPATYILWGAMALAVCALLFVVAKLLPKQGGPN